MTQAFNLSQLANNLNTAGQLDATDGLVNAVPVANGGTAASTSSAARTNLGLAIGTDVPSPTGTGASGTWGINITGNAATASSASSATTAGSVTNGVYTISDQTIGGTKTFTNGVRFNDGTVQTTAAVIAAPAFLAVGAVMVLYNFSATSYAPGSNVTAANTGYQTSTMATNTNAFPSAAQRDGSVNVPGAGSGAVGNTAAVTGTWRTLSGVSQAVYDSCSSSTAAFPFLAVRIA
jgi:hypothetical protein